MKSTTRINRNKRMPTFKIELWHKDNYGDWQKDKKFMKQMWSGLITHIQSGDSKLFGTITEMLKFMEDRRN